MPGTLGAPVDRLAGGGGTLGYLDYSHPIFEPFKDPRNGNFSDVRFFKYRALTPAATDKVLARFDDGAAAMVERRVGSGRVIAVHLDDRRALERLPDERRCSCRSCTTIVSYLAQYQRARGLVHRRPDARHLRADRRDRARGPAPAPHGADAQRPSGVVVSPSGEQSTLGEGGAPSVELAEQGFYSVRLQGIGRAAAVRRWR